MIFWAILLFGASVINAELQGVVAAPKDHLDGVQVAIPVALKVETGSESLSSPKVDEEVNAEVKQVLEVPKFIPLAVDVKKVRVFPDCL